MLEFLIWYLLGWKGIEDFQTQRIKEDNCEIPEDVFFNSIDKECVRLKKSVAKVSSAWSSLDFITESANLTLS